MAAAGQLARHPVDDLQVIGAGHAAMAFAALIVWIDVSDLRGRRRARAERRAAGADQAPQTPHVGDAAQLDGELAPGVLVQRVEVILQQRSGPMVRPQCRLSKVKEQRALVRDERERRIALAVFAAEVAHLALPLRIAGVAFILRQQADQKPQRVLRLVAGDVLHPVTVVRCIAGVCEHGGLLGCRMRKVDRLRHRSMSRGARGPGVRHGSALRRCAAA